MSQPETLLLGFIAGVTILLGLPMGRMQNLSPGTRQFLNALAVGILIFLLWDVLTHAWEPIDHSLVEWHDDDGGLGPVFRYGALFFGGLAAGLFSLVFYERWLNPKHPPEPYFGPGAMAADEPTAAALPGWSAAQRLAFLIALGIGLHNFGEGLAIGGSAASDEVSLATVLVIGFALHNATEGFGIVAPLAGEPVRPSWGFLLLMGIIAGGPTVVGTAIGRQFTSDAVNVLFLALAAGSILYVIVQLLGVAYRARARELLYAGLLAGIAAGFITDMVVIAGGA